MVGNPFPFFTRLSQRGVGRQPQGGSYRSQLELQAINERGWLLTKAAEAATSKPKTTANARNFIIDPIESPSILDLNFEMVGGKNAGVQGHEYGVPVAFIGHGKRRRAMERLVAMRRSR